MKLALVSGVGPLTRKALIDRFGSAQDVFDAPPSLLREVPGIGPKLCREIVEANRSIDVEAEFERCKRHGIEILTDTDSRYPRLLQEIPDPPGVLFLAGRVLPEDALAIAIVGTRHASHYGLRQAERLAGSLARCGLTIVSGLARGIDGAAHRAALAAGGRTIAVLAGGLADVYPPEHRELAEQVKENGALLSENPPGGIPSKGAFPRRNRLITGMSLGVIVVEAAERSGALISARHAMEQNREVFAVPGRVDTRVARGCHRLIRDGATLVESAEDVLDQLGPLVEGIEIADGRTMHHPAELQLNDREQKVLDAIPVEATNIDRIVTDSGLPVHRVMATISVLEMRHLVRRVEGNRLMRR